MACPQLTRVPSFQSNFYSLTMFALANFISYSSSLAFEKAYCLYRLNRTQESLAVLNKENNPDAKHKELKAQVLYRMERYIQMEQSVT